MNFPIRWVNPFTKPDVRQSSFDLFDDAFLASLPQAVAHTAMSTILGKLREQTSKRLERFAQYKTIARDPIARRAIEWISDDATVFDVDREKTVWIEVEGDKETEKIINQNLKKYVEPFIDAVANSIAKNGEFAFKVMEPKPTEKLLPIVPVKNIETFTHIIDNDGEHYFAFMEDVKNETLVKGSLTNEKSFIHFINTSLENSSEIKIKGKDDKDKTKITEYNVFHLQGESVLLEALLDTYRIVVALENAMIAARLSKSKIVRFAMVEVAKMGDQKVQNVVNYVDQLVNKNETISTSNDVYDALRIQVEPVTAVIPIKQDKGRITLEEFTSSADIKDIADVDHFMGKYFAGLSVPRQFFSYDEMLVGQGGVGSMMRLDVRYARIVRKVQRIIINGVKEYIDIIFKTFDIKDKVVKVHILKSNTSEDEERYMELDARMTTFSTFWQLISDPTTMEMDPKRLEIAEKYFNEVAPIPKMKDFIEGIISKTNIKKKPAAVK